MQMALNNVNLGYTREFTKRDLNQVMEIAESSFSEYYSNGLIMDLHKSWPQAFRVYVFGDRIIGFIVGSKVNSEEARVLLLAVDENYRGMGIGRLLLDEFLQLCLRENIISVRLEVRTDNDRAISFYKKLGFVITARMKAYYSDSSDAFTMWKVI
ncbi:MAG TPA: ribosomal protein S18-alanine N-acetyltransferase [Thermoplasmataceae archaeon]|nr:ribosomal protein S18-alanine N-acetyltransferase [Thermoplasmataceae archaeon]